jgi:hypothetical protein
MSLHSFPHWKKIVGRYLSLLCEAAGFCLFCLLQFDGIILFLEVSDAWGAIL